MVNARLRDWVGELDRARHATGLPAVIPTPWLKEMRAEAAANRDGEYSAMPKEVFSALVAEASLGVGPELAREWRQVMADAQDAPQDIVVTESAAVLDLVDAALSTRRTPSRRVGA
ncbi:MAG: hypothetical protein ACYDEA_03490 [Candidatus Dormibacteria bacterium]